MKGNLPNHVLNVFRTDVRTYGATLMFTHESSENIDEKIQKQLDFIHAIRCSLIEIKNSYIVFSRGKKTKPFR